MTEKLIRSWTDVTHGMRGFFAVLCGEFQPEYGSKYADIIQSGIGSYKTYDEAKKEAMEWAEAEGVSCEAIGRKGE